MLKSYIQSDKYNLRVTLFVQIKQIKRPTFAY